MNNSIEPFIHTKIVVLNKNEPASVAAKAMSEQRVGCVVVSDTNGHFIGVVTDRDIVRQLIAQGRSIDVSIGSLLIGTLISVEPDADLVEVLDVMEEYGIRRVPVIRKRGKREHCDGLVSLDDLIVAKRVSRDQLSRILRHQVRPRKVFQRLDRSQARRHQTYGNFMKRLRSATGLETGRAEEFLLTTLSAIVQRLPKVGAEQFISQLPGVLQDSLFTFPTGPNRNLTAKKLMNQLQTEFDLSKTKVQYLLEASWRTLVELVKSGELDQVLGQLPKDFRELLGYESYDGQRVAGEYYEGTFNPYF